VVPTLVALNLAVFAWTVVEARSLLDNADAALFRVWALVPAAVAEGEWWRLITAGFLHIGPLHIAFNMYALWVLGRDLEIVLGGAGSWRSTWCPCSAAPRPSCSSPPPTSTWRARPARSSG
jgi:membrane associated rhomboid family serine protease